MKIVVVGLGYVGLSNAVLLAQHNEVIGVDISQERVHALSIRKSPIIDAELSEYLASKDLNLSASTDLEASVKDTDYVIVSTPTNYDENTNFFDTSSVEEVISRVAKYAPHACIVVKSTVPIGFTEGVRNRLGTKAVIFCPEFLREGAALYDNLYPSRIIIGENSKRAEVFAQLLAEGAVKKDVDILFTEASEAEAIKLFANTYLAMRVAFFNELDSYALSNALNSRDIINGLSLDPRIGDQYNNPSYGYGGYCLPKDTKQLLAHYNAVPQKLIQAIVDSNSARQNFLVKEILKSQPRTIGIYRLIMKAGSDNFRQSSISNVILLLQAKGAKIVIYEPHIKETMFLNSEVISNLQSFKEKSDVILANRLSADLDDIIAKVFTRDLFQSN